MTSSLNSEFEAGLNRPGGPTEDEIFEAVSLLRFRALRMLHDPERDADTATLASFEAALAAEMPIVPPDRIRAIAARAIRHSGRRPAPQFRPDPADPFALVPCPDLDARLRATRRKALTMYLETRAERPAKPKEATLDREREEHDAAVERFKERAEAVGAPASLPAHLAVRPFAPKAFEWVDPSSLPRRDWLLGTRLIRREVSLTLAPGGVGKTSMLVAEALAMATGKALLHDQPAKPLRVWLWNGEEPEDELKRRVMAAAIHFGLTPDDIADRLYVDTGHDLPLVIAEQTRDGPRVLRPVVDRLVTALKERAIDVMIVDPFISSHRIIENDTPGMQEAATAWKTVAYEAGVAVDLAHHTRKLNGQEATVDDGRGGSALRDKARHARALSPMNEREAATYGVRGDERFSYFATGAGEKSNMAARASGKSWFKLESVGLGNGAFNAPQDHVAVVTPWTPVAVPQELDPGAIARLADLMGDAEWRDNCQAQGWVGPVVAEAFGVEMNAGWKTSVKAIIASLKAKKVIIERTGQDKARKAVPVVTMGRRETAEI